MCELPLKTNWPVNDDCVTTCPVGSGEDPLIATHKVCKACEVANCKFSSF